MSAGLARLIVVFSSAMVTIAAWYVAADLLGMGDVVGALAGLAFGVAEGLFLHRVFSRMRPG